MKRRLAGLAAVALAVGGLSVLGAAPANAAGCSTQVPQTWSVYNINCSWAKHFDVVNGSTYIYAPAVGPGQTSMQSACWVGVTAYGVSKSNIAIT